MPIEVKPHELAGALKDGEQRIKAALPLASYAASAKYAAYLAYLVDEKGITDQGILKNSIKAIRNADGTASTAITAPHAGIVELGARPHGVSAEGREAIKQWCMRKLGLDEKAAESATWGICQKLKAEGQKPTYLVRDSMPKAVEFFAAELERILNRRSSDSS